MSLRIDAWSWSRFDSWRKCPLQFKEKFLTKTIKDDQTPAMARGDKMHKSVEAYVKGATETFPAGFEAFRVNIEGLRASPNKLVEAQYALDHDWKPTGWFAKGRNPAWLRVILDVAIVYPDNTADVRDWKTGKKYGSNAEQLELFAVATFHLFPWVQHVTTGAWYVDLKADNEDLVEYPQRDAAKLRAKWEAAVQPMFAEEVFAPKPGEHCRFCPLARSNGGTCRYG